MNLFYNLRRTALLCGFGLLSLKGSAQVSNYVFSETSGTYTNLVGGTVLGAATNDDTGFPGLPIGFTFTFNGVDYTTFSAQSNGFIALGGAISSSYTAISTGTSNNVICALNGDLQGNTTTGQLSYLTEGTAPNQVLTVEWKSYRHFGAAGDDYNFQIKLYESTNIVEVHYGSFIQNATARTRQVGLRGNSSADFNNRTTSPNWATTIAGAVNTASCALTTAVIPASGQIFRWTGPPPTPPTPVQDPGIPTCLAGTNIDVTGTPIADVVWYWQSSPTGTSTADPYAGPYTVFANGTYYLRAYNTVANLWSLNSSSITITNFPTAATPPAPTADINPSCVTTGTILTADPAPMGTEYYWQGTNSAGIDNSLPATATYTVSTSGTYYLAAYETVSGCWSATSSLAVIVDTYIPDAPVASISDYYICSGSTTQMITSTVPGSGMAPFSSGMVNISIPDSPLPGISSVITSSGIPAGAIVAEMAVMLNITHTWDSDLDIYLMGPNGVTIDLCTDNGGSGDNFTNTIISSAGVTSITGGVAPMTGTFSPEQSFSGLYSLLNGDWTLMISDDAGGDAGTLINWSLMITYTLPVTTIDWYDASIAGAGLGSGSSIESIGTTVLGSPATAGDYSFFAEAVSGGCVSAARTEIMVHVADVVVQLLPVDLTCNNGNDGSFTLGTVTCGTGPFLYSVDGGAFGAIPADLTLGDHDVIVQDAGMLLSGTYVVTIGNAPAPTALTVTGFTNDNVDITWTAGGSETEWYVEWGAPGFTPGTGTEIGSAGANSNSYTISGLSGFTTYDIYVAADCGGSTTPGDWIMVSQTTMCDPFVAQAFCESFDSGSSTQDCWTVLNENGDPDSWNMDDTFNPFTGDEAAAIITDGNGGGNNDWLITPQLILTNNEIFSFHYRVEDLSEPNDFEVLLSTTGVDPADFTTVLVPFTSYSNETYDVISIDLTAYSGEVFIAFHIPNAGLDGWVLYIDEVCIDICTPDPGTDGSTNACRLDNTLDLNTVIVQGETNGVWEFLPNPGVVSGSDLNLSLLPEGTYDFEYIVTTACTTDTTIATVTVFPASSAGTGSTISDICSNHTAINLVDGLSGTIDLGGTWTNNSGEGTLTGSVWDPAVTTMPGSYTFDYVVTNGICPNDTSTVTVDVIDCTGIDENENSFISVYPNPVVNELTIANLSIDLGVIEVLDMQGKVVNSIQVNGVYGNYILNMNGMERGMYMIRITTESSIKEGRVVKL